VEISQYIEFGDLTTPEDSMTVRLDSEPTLQSNAPVSTPPFSLDELDSGIEPRLSNDDEDALLKVNILCTISCAYANPNIEKDTTRSFADWIMNFIRRVIQLLENLPEEGTNGSAGGATEGAVFRITTFKLTLTFSRSSSRGCRGWCLQPNLCSSIRATVRSSAEHGI